MNKSTPLVDLHCWEIIAIHAGVRATFSLTRVCHGLYNGLNSKQFFQKLSSFLWPGAMKNFGNNPGSDLWKRLCLNVANEGVVLNASWAFLCDQDNDFDMLGRRTWDHGKCALSVSGEHYCWIRRRQSSYPPETQLQNAIGAHSIGSTSEGDPNQLGFWPVFDAERGVQENSFGALCDPLIPANGLCPKSATAIGMTGFCNSLIDTAHYHVCQSIAANNGLTALVYVTPGALAAEENNLYVQFTSLPARKSLMSSYPFQHQDQKWIHEEDAWDSWHKVRYARFDDDDNPQRLLIVDDFGECHVIGWTVVDDFVKNPEIVDAFSLFDEKREDVVDSFSSSLTFDEKRNNHVPRKPIQACCASPDFNIVAAYGNSTLYFRLDGNCTSYSIPAGAMDDAGGVSGMHLLANDQSSLSSVSIGLVPKEFLLSTFKPPPGIPCTLPDTYYALCEVVVTPDGLDTDDEIQIRWKCAFQRSHALEAVQGYSNKVVRNQIDNIDWTLEQHFNVLNLPVSQQDTSMRRGPTPRTPPSQAFRHTTPTLPPPTPFPHHNMCWPRYSGDVEDSQALDEETFENYRRALDEMGVEALRLNGLEKKVRENTRSSSYSKSSQRLLIAFSQFCMCFDLRLNDGNGASIWAYRPFRYGAGGGSNMDSVSLRADGRVALIAQRDLSFVGKYNGEGPMARNRLRLIAIDGYGDLDSEKGWLPSASTLDVSAFHCNTSDEYFDKQVRAQNCGSSAFWLDQPQKCDYCHHFGTRVTCFSCLKAADFDFESCAQCADFCTDICWRQSLPTHRHHCKASRGANSFPCFACGKTSEGAMKQCSVCKMATYCSVQCQKADWKFHKQNDCKK